MTLFQSHQHHLHIHSSYCCRSLKILITTTASAATSSRGEEHDDVLTVRTAGIVPLLAPPLAPRRRPCSSLDARRETGEGQLQAWSLPGNVATFHPWVKSKTFLRMEISKKCHQSFKVIQGPPPPPRIFFMRKHLYLAVLLLRSVCYDKLIGWWMALISLTPKFA